MAEKKRFLLRIDSDIYAALEKWAADDLRSINAQIEFLLSDLVKKKFNKAHSAKINIQSTNDLLSDPQDIPKE